MKKWRCTVCGYVHTGDEPPDECPVCGADKSLFEEIIEEEQPAAPAEPSTEASAVSTNRWKCGVCGYIHSGTAPPSECPVCGADQVRFSPAPEEGPVRIDSIDSNTDALPDAAADAITKDSGRKAEHPVLAKLRALRYPPWLDTATTEMTRRHVHPISVHLPNGVLPVSFFFMALAALFGSETLSKAAYYNLLVVLFAMPLVLFSGFNDWQRRYGGRISQIILTKIICGTVVFIGLLLLVLLWSLRPELLIADVGGRWLFALISVVTLAAAVTAGLMGGKLVFPNAE